MKRRAFRAALPYTLPVLMGYLFLGIAYGVLLAKAGYSAPWALFTSAGIYAGSMQFVLVDLFAGPFDLLAAALMTLMVNARHVFYGLSMLDSFKDCGRFKPYMIFSLSDETYSILCSTPTPEAVDPQWFRFFIAALNHFYWIAGSVLGAVAGTVIPFNSRGIDFAMTALFLVIFVEQWEKSKNHIPAVIGVLVTIACWLLFGATSFIVFSMLFMFLLLAAQYGWKRLRGGGCG